MLALNAQIQIATYIKFLRYLLTVASRLRTIMLAFEHRAIHKYSEEYVDILT